MTKETMVRLTAAGATFCTLVLVALDPTGVTAAEPADSPASHILSPGPAPVRPAPRTAPTGTSAPHTRRTPAAFTRDTPLSDAIDTLRHATTPPLNIVVYWKDLEANAGVSRDTTIGFDGIGGLRLRQYLETLLTSLSATSLAPIGYTVDRGVVVIATKDNLPKPREITRVYDVTDLVAPPSRPTLFDAPMFGAMMYGGIPRRPLGNLGPYNTPRGRPRARQTRPASARRR